MAIYPDEAWRVQDWLGNHPLSWHQFLQAQKFEHSIRYAINDQTRSLIGSNKELAERGFKITNDALRTGFSELSQSIDDLRESHDENAAMLNATLKEGFRAILMELGPMRQSLQELVRIATTPSQTWAYEQYQIAKDNFQRRLFAEAKESIMRAIDGHGSYVGYKTDFRFHFLLGAIQLYIC